jgi:hypothetical protein
MVKILSLALTLLLLTTPAGAADWEGVFEGTIGKARVIVELNAGTEKSDFKGGYIDGARYSYVPKVRDINLILDQEGDTLRFTETLWQHRRFADEEDKKITGKWTLSVNGDTALGLWSAPDGTSLTPISLTRVQLVPNADVPDGGNRLAATYDTLWLESVSFTDAGTAKTFGNVEVRFSKDSAFAITFPVLGQFPDGTVKAKANALLLVQHLKSVALYRNCLNGVPPNWETDEETSPEFNFEIHYASPRLLSYTEYGSVFCGGAHGNNYVSPQTFDLGEPANMGGTSGLDLTPQGFGRILKLATKDERIAFERFALDRWTKAAAADKEYGETCKQGWLNDTTEGEKEFALSLTIQGLAVTRNDYPHVASVCLFQPFNPTIIPWADLKPYLRADQTLLTTEIK